MPLAEKYANGTATAEETAELERQVREAAKEAMTNTKVADKNGDILTMYHGTPAEFTVFDRSKIGSTGRMEGSGFNFTPSRGRAESYSNYGRVLEGFLNIERPLSNEKKTLSVPKLAQLIRSIDPTGDNIISDYARDTSDYGKPSFIRRESITAARSLWDYSDSDVDIYSFISAADPDAESLIEAFSEMGYDGLIHYNDDGRIKTAVAFSSEQFKLSDPVTYDSDGNIIPLSERFRTDRTGDEAWKNEDIRYSARDFGLEEFDKQTKNDVLLRGGVIINLESELDSHIAKALGSDDKKNLYLGAIAEKTMDLLEKETGQTLFKRKGQYTFSVSYDDIRHIADHYSSTQDIREAVKTVIKMLADHDTIEAYKANDGQQQRIRLTKKMPHADYLTIDIVSGKKRAIDIATVYITKKNRGNQSVPAAGSKSNASPHRGSVSSNTTVSQPSNSVNPVSQEISSAATSIKQVPALFTNKNVQFGDTNIDIGGGKYDLATNYLAERGTKNMLFDPYNQSKEVNKATLDYLMSGKKADTVTCANVLNVIAEADARANVILEAAKAIKPDGKAYFMVYEGDGSGVGKKTSAGWQNNRKTADYVGEIGQYFGTVERKGKLITATNPDENLPKASWEIEPGNAIRFSSRADSDIALWNPPDVDTRGIYEAVKNGSGKVDGRFDVTVDAGNNGFNVTIKDTQTGETYKDGGTVEAGENAEAFAERYTAAIIRNIKSGKPESTSRSTAGIYIPKGEMPVRDVNAPVFDENGDKVRRFMRTVLEFGAVTDDISPSD